MNHLKHFLLILICCLSAFANGQNLHAIVFAATDDATIGDGTEKSMEMISAEIEAIAKNADLTPVLYYRKGQRFSRANLERVYQQLDGENLEDDVVLFYFLGHGYSERGKYPNLLFLNTDGELDETEIADYSVNLKTVSDVLLAKKARLTIVIGEACNDELEVDEVTENGEIFNTMKPVVADKSRYKRLFVHASGSFVFWSSQTGQPSYISPTKGGAFTQGFLSSLKKQTEKNDEPITTTSWSKVIEGTINNTQTIAKKNKLQYVQNPKFSITNKLRYYTPPTDDKDGERKKYGFLTWIVGLVAPNNVEKSFKKALKDDNLLALEEILTARGEEGDKIKQKILKQSPVSFYMAQAIIYEEKGDTMNAMTNYKIAYELGKENRSKRDQQLIDKMLKRNAKSKVIDGLNEAKNYQTWLKSKFFRMKSVFEDDIEVADIEIVKLEGEITEIEEAIKQDENQIMSIEQSINSDNSQISDLEKRVAELDKKRQQKVEIKLKSAGKETKETIKKIENYLAELERTGAVDEAKEPQYIDDAVVEFKFAKRKTAASLEPTTTGYELGKYCTSDIQETANAIMTLLLKPVDDVPKNKRNELKIKVKITGNADWIGARNGKPLGIQYTAETDVFEEYVNQEGEKKAFRLTAGETVNITNEELAFLRAYCAYNEIISILNQKGINDYQVQFQAIEHELPEGINEKDRTAGEDYRGVDIDMTVENLYKHYLDEIEEIETEIQAIKTKIRQKRRQITEIADGISEKETLIENRRQEIEKQKSEKERLNGIIKLAKADREIERVKALQEN
ncbi:MAG: caspase family protein [Saprospiraceae bacterium]